jgi:hypothetical protein
VKPVLIALGIVALVVVLGIGAVFTVLALFLANEHG